MELISISKEQQEQKQNINRDLRADFIQNYRPIKEQRQFIINEDKNIKDLKGLNKELLKRGFYPIKNISYSFIKKLCGFRVPKRTYEKTINLNGAKKTIKADYNILISKFLKKFYKNKVAYFVVSVSRDFLILDYAFKNINKSLSLRFNNQINK